jgi:hypothetical protein
MLQHMIFKRWNKWAKIEGFRIYRSFQGPQAYAVRYSRIISTTSPASGAGNLPSLGSSQVRCRVSVDQCVSTVGAVKLLRQQLQSWDWCGRTTRFVRLALTAVVQNWGLCGCNLSILINVENQSYCDMASHPRDLNLLKHHYENLKSCIVNKK